MGERAGAILTFGVDLIPVNLEDIKNGRKEGSAEWVSHRCLRLLLTQQGGIGNLFWLADPTSEVAMVIFNSALPYGSESVGREVWL